jgi:murein DD-endopeptidase MepM/ murein hydrolase activator NlpD
MADPQDKHAVVEGDASKVPVQVAPGTTNKDAAPDRPAKGTQLVFGGKDPQSPWGQIAALIGPGGKAPYTLVSSAVLAKAQHRGKKPGSAEEPKEEKKKEEAPKKEPVDHEVTPATEAEIFIHGEEFTHANHKARVWAHAETAELGPRPLLVFLHGIRKPGNYPQLNDDIKTEYMVHLGMLAKKLIDEKKVEPLIIACPTYSPDGEKGIDLWRNFELSAFVEDLRKVLDQHGLRIDDEEVAVAGHSGAGCAGAGGLLKIIAHGAKFGDHPLKVLGFADTCCNDAAGGIISKSLRKVDPKTVLYSMNRGHGGGGYAEGGAKAWGDYLGAKHKVESPEYAFGEGPEISDYRTDGENPPRRFALKMPATPDKGVAHDTAVFTHEKEWYESGAAAKGKLPGAMGTHYAMALNWTWYALQRFYPRVSPEPSAELPASDQSNKHKAEVGRAGDDFAQVPEGPPAWKVPAERPRANFPSNFADAGSGRFWPVRTHSSYGRAVAFIGEDGNRYGGGPSGDPASQRNFLAAHDGKDGRWLNAGVDLYADFGDFVVAPEQGVIARFDPLYPGVFRLLLHCSSGLAICCGGLDPDSLTTLKLAVGDKVSAGQPIGTVGRADDSQPMLHFEIYPQGTPEPVAIWESDASTRGKVLDPTAYLLDLAVRGR